MFDLFFVVECVVVGSFVVAAVFVVCLNDVCNICVYLFLLCRLSLYVFVFVVR